MAFMDWNAEYETKVAIIDAQHRGLVEILNQIHDSLEKGEAPEKQMALLDTLADRGVEHFATEEQLFRESGFPGYMDHKAEHDNLVAEARKIQVDVKEAGTIVSPDLLEFLKSWLMDHTVGKDREAGAFLNARGVS